MKCRKMGKSKIGTRPQIKRDSGIKEAAAPNADHSTAQDTAARAQKNAPQLTQEPERIRKRYAFLRERLRADASRPACRHICEGVARYHLNIDVSGSH